jgi:methylase of polypeptide subunit release factors
VSTTSSNASPHDPAEPLPGAESLPAHEGRGAEVAGLLREALRKAAFTADGLLDLLGAPAYAALARGETVPALRATRSGGPVATLVRLFLLQRAVQRAELSAVLGEELVAAAEECGWLRTGGTGRTGAAAGTEREDRASAGELRACVDVRPYGGPAGEDWYVVSDLGCAVGGAGGIGKRAEGVVLGVGGASTTLAGLTVRAPVDSVLDLGTGSGIQALHAAPHAARVTATDLNPRALVFAALTLALSGAEPARLLAGSLFEPVGTETFDLIVSNPPFVISPGARLTYRDGGREGDGLCRELVSSAGERLNEGGYAQFLANWEHVEGESWTERVRAWVPVGCDAWIVQREVQDIAQYAELWLRDAGDHKEGSTEYGRRYEEWLDSFAARGTTSVGFGWITLRRSAAAEPSVTIEEWPHPVEQPLGPAVRAHFARVDYLRTHDDAALLADHFRLAPEVVQEQIGQPGAENPEYVVLRQHRGMRRATRVDTIGAGFAGVCDGTLGAGAILDAIAQLVDEDPVRLRDQTPAQIRLLIEQGFLYPVGLSGSQEAGEEGTSLL